MITNNSIREFLSLPTVDTEIEVWQVDRLGTEFQNTLMFINKPDLDLSSYDKNNTCCVYLIDDSYPEISSDYNDFIRVSNPKFKFCKIVEYFKLESVFQRYLEDFVSDNCSIDPQTIIGGTDFSPVLGDDGELVQFPQMGGVSIDDDVVIKYNTMIGKGTFGYTRIGKNTMIDYGCQIGHNCTIGARCIIAAGTIIGGSTIIGDNTTIGIGAKIRNGLHIGQNVSIGMGTVVIKDIPDNCVVVGNPARVIEHKPIFDKGGLV